MQQNHPTSLLVLDDVIKSAKTVNYFNKNVKFGIPFLTQNTKDWWKTVATTLKENRLGFQNIYLKG